MFVTGKPKGFLRLDGLVLFLATLFLFESTHQKWWIFLALFFVPDIFMLGYLKDTKVGALFYNVGHSYFAPAMTLFIGWRVSSLLTMAIGIIWLGHIGFDRAIGYGLKYDDNFKTTHLGSLVNNKL